MSPSLPGPGNPDHHDDDGIPGDGARPSDTNATSPATAYSDTTSSSDVIDPGVATNDTGATGTLCYSLESFKASVI